MIQDDNLDDFVIIDTACIRDALAKIDANQHGAILARDGDDCIIGLATDGDIRRALLAGCTIDDGIRNCLNADFHWVPLGTQYENILKVLDQSIRVIPILDDARRLRGIVSQSRLPNRAEKAVFARARAPVRVSFGGGGSDLTHFFVETGGAVINATISLYSHAALRVRNDQRIHIHSGDLGDRFEAADLSQALQGTGKFGLFQALLRSVQPEFGFDLFVHSDFPIGSGLGGSAAVASSVLGCLNMMRRDRWDNYELAELAFEAERLHLGIAGGWQDQYASAFGGFNFMEFTKNQNVVHPLRLHNDVLLELEESLILCDTGIAHHSGDIHSDQRESMQAAAVKESVSRNVALTYEMRNHLLRGRLTEFGGLLHQSWTLKRGFSSMITNRHLDDIYEGALQAGAVGGKLLGAGGGGFFLFYCAPFLRHRLTDYLSSRGLKVYPFRFDEKGTQSWTAREAIPA